MTKLTECGDKVAHETKALALKHLRALQRKTAAAHLGVYQCKHCRKWHVGNRRTTPNGRRPRK